MAVLQVVVDLACLAITLFKGHFPAVPPSLRYAIGGVALCLSAYGVSQAIRLPQLKDIEVSIAGLPSEFDGYRIVQLTDLHISRLFPASWTEGVVARTNALDADLIVITEILSTAASRHVMKMSRPLRHCKRVTESTPFRAIMSTSSNTWSGCVTSPQ